MSTFKSASLTNPRLKHPDEISQSPFDNYNQEVYQYLQFNNTQLPEINDWETGREYELTIKVKMEKQIDKGNDESVADFKVLKIKTNENYEEVFTDEQKHYKDLLE